MIVRLLSPGLVLSLLLGSLYSLIFFLLFGRGGSSLGPCWLVGSSAFLMGQILASIHPVLPLALGEVHFLEASAICLIALISTWHWGPRGR